MNQAAELTPVESPEMPPAEGGLDLLAMAWRRKWIAVSMTILALGLGYLYFLKATPVYKSSAQILLIKKTADLPVAGTEGQVNYEDELSTHMILICSPLIVGEAVAKHDLASLPSLRGHGDATQAIIGGLKATRAGGRDASDPNVFELAYEGLDPGDCAKIVTAVFESYQDFLGETYQDFSQETIRLITKAKDELHKQLTEKETTYREFRQESPLLWKGEAGANVHEARLAEVEAARSAVLVENSGIKAKIAAIDAAIQKGGNREALLLLIAADDSTESPASSRSPRGAFEQQMFATLLEEQMLLEDYGPDHPKVKAIQKKMQLIREHLGTMPLPEGAEDEPTDFLAVYLESLRQQLDVGQQRLHEYDQLFEQEREAAKAMASFQVSDETFRNEIARTQQLFDGIVKRLEEMNLIEDYGGVSAQLISPPSMGALVKPKMPIVLSVAGVLGLFIGFGLGYLVELADMRFRSPDDIQRQLGLPLVGHIPVIEAGQRKASRADKKSGDHAPSPLLCTYHRPKSRQAEAYRAVRTAVYYSGQGHKLIQITSPSLGDGKTTLATNLAVAIANSGKNVLLVDADFRRPRIHKYFALDNETGFSSLIAEDKEIPDVVQETVVPNLWALTCGPRPQNAADVLTSPRLPQLFDVLKEKYDFVIVDSPPLLAVTDASVIAPQADAVLMVVRLTKHARHAAVRATEMLDSLGARVLGVVINGIGKQHRGYGREYRYGGYGYGGYRYGYRYGYASAYSPGYGYYGGNGRDGYYEDESEKEPAADSNEDASR